MIQKNVGNFRLGANSKNHPPGNSPTPIAIDIYKYTLPVHTHSERFFAHETTSEFESVVLWQKLARSTPGKTFDKLKSKWLKAKKILAAITVAPSEYSFYADLFYQAAATQKIHPSYFSEILKLINEYGYFLSVKFGITYQAIKPPSTYAKQRMISAIEDSGARVGRTMKPITLELLEAKKKEMPAPTYNFMYVMLWLGLRPCELSIALSDTRSYKTTTVEGVLFLDVYQGKLVGMRREDRWKRIPVVEPEQHHALALIQRGECKRPHSRTVHKYLGNEFGLYSSRKAFAKLMLSRGWQFEAASKYLGHQTTKTTEKYYIDSLTLQTSNALLAVGHRLGNKRS